MWPSNHERVSAAKNWPSAQEVLAGSSGQASMKSWLEAPAKQARKPSERTLAIVLSRTSNECCVPYHLRVYNYDQRIGDQGGGRT
jgi:hypothetical protein